MKSATYRLSAKHATFMCAPCGKIIPSIFFGGLASTMTTALTSSLSRIVVALESRKGSMAGDRHNTLVVPSPAYFSSDKGVSEVMKVEVLYPGPPVGSMKSGLLSFSH